MTRTLLALVTTLCLACTDFNRGASAAEQLLQRIAFGSCCDQDKPAPVWDAIAAQKPDLFLFLGDNIYADTHDMSVLQAKYGELAANAGYQKLKMQCPILATWDDHDYGVGDGGAEFKMRDESKRLFAEFFELPIDSPVRKRPGVYDSQFYGPVGRRVQVILLDTRYFRGPLVKRTKAGNISDGSPGPYTANRDTSATILGDEQWEWLAEQLRIPADVRIIASSIQVVSDEHGWEKWGNFPYEQSRLYQTICEAGAEGVLILSGDRHHAEISRKDDSVVPYPLYDITSSGLTHGKGWDNETNRHRIGSMYRMPNFGLITINWETDDPEIHLQILSEKGQLLLRHALRLSELCGPEKDSSQKSHPKAAQANDGNRLAYLDAFCNPYYVRRDFPKLVTPQWVGEPDVECVVTLTIDDMRDVQRYEHFLRPILDRLKEIDGQAPLSIFTNDVDPTHPHLQKWLKEGLSIETHTIDHPCPCLQDGDFAKSKRTFDRCVDKMAAVPNSHPVAFRFPCCDSLNTPSPRAFAEILGKRTPNGNFVQIDSSVCCVFTADDAILPRDLIRDSDGRERFAKYLPFPSFVNKIENYPYPYVINQSCWEFPLAVPNDWLGQNLHAPLNPTTIEDMKASLDATVLKQGVMNVVFHPHGWIRSEQLVQFIDYAQSRYGKKVKFLNFRECLEKLNTNLLAGQQLKSSTGSDNGVRLFDVNQDGFVDIVIGNDKLLRTRVWSPENHRWIETEFPLPITSTDVDGKNHATGVRFGVLGDPARPVCIVRNEHISGAYRWDGKSWTADSALLEGLELNGELLRSSRDGVDMGMRLHDLDGDGFCELLIANAKQNAAFVWKDDKQRWVRLSFGLPEDLAFVDRKGHDNGLRLVDIDEDGFDDVVFSNERAFSTHGFTSLESGWSRQMRRGKRGDNNAIPMISRFGTNNGAWFARGCMWIQNEFTQRLPDGVARMSFADLQGEETPPPKSPEDSRATIQLAPGYRVELVAAEPLTMDPVNFDWGPDGKLWVVEMADYPLGLDNKGKPGGRVRCLEDTDADGKYDKSTVFLDGIPFPTGVMAWRDGVLVSAAPEIFYAVDTDGDGRADKREVLFSGFGKGNQQHRVNGFSRGLDNWIYVANGDSGGTIWSVKTGETLELRGRDLRIRPDEGAMETVIGQTQFGRNRDDWGNWFGCNNAQPMIHFVLDDHYLRRNPHFLPPQPKVDLVTIEGSPIHPIGRLLSHWEGYQPPLPGHPSRFTSASSAMVYRDALLGPAFEDSAFICEPVHNLVHRQVLSPRGVSFHASPANQPIQREFFASSDPWCRPTTVRTGTDGALWIADMYRLVIEHPQWINDAVEKQLDLRAGHDRGRIYRVVPMRHKIGPILHLDQLSVAEIVSLLESPNGTTRDLTQQWLVERKSDETIKSSAVPLLVEMVTRGSKPLARLHAMCALHGMDSLKPTEVARVLRDGHPGLRRHAVRLAEQFLGESEQVAEALLSCVTASDPHVQLQLAYTLGEWRDPRAGRALGQIILTVADDSYLMAAAMSSVNEHNLGELLDTVLPRVDTSLSKELLEPLLCVSASIGNEREAKKALIAAIMQYDGKGNASQFSAVAGVLEVLDRRGKSTAETLEDPIRSRLSEIVESARITALNTRAPESDRLAAIRLLANRLNGEAKIALLSELISPQHSTAVQTAAVLAVANTLDDDVPATLLASWQSHSPSVRSQVIESLLSRDRWIAELLNAVEKGSVSTADIYTLRRQQLLSLKNEALRAKAERLFAAGAPTRNQVLQSYQGVLKLKGHHDSGRTLFAKHCAACHLFEGKGSDIGPNLHTLSNRSPDALLLAVLDPNQAVEDRYKQYVVLTDDGRSATGIITNETSAGLTLQTAEGRERVILRKEIEHLKSTGKSLMPEGLEQDLAAQDLADLITYIGTQSPSPVTTSDNSKALPRTDGNGIVELLARRATFAGDTLVFEPRHQNLGYWSSQNDRAVWDFQVATAGRYKISFSFACDDLAQGNEFQLQVGSQTLIGKVPSTGGWDQYEQLVAGHIHLNAGTHRLSLCSHGSINQYLIDLRSVRIARADQAVSVLKTKSD